MRGLLTLPTSSKGNPKILFDSINNIVTPAPPAYFKHAVVQPFLKKTNLDPSSPINYRPIFKLPFT